MLDSRVGGCFVCPRSEFLSRPLLWAFTDTDHEQLHEIMEARTIIEKNLAGLAAERASPEQIEEIHCTIQLTRDCIARGDSMLEADMAFHLAVSTTAECRTIAAQSPPFDRSLTRTSTTECIHRNPSLGLLPLGADRTVLCGAPTNPPKSIWDRNPGHLIPSTGSNLGEHRDPRSSRWQASSKSIRCSNRRRSRTPLHEERICGSKRAISDLSFMLPPESPAGCRR
jgi:FCD domain-containing protein